MKIEPKHRVAILLHQGIRGVNGKTGLAYLRYGLAKVVAVIDSDCPGESLRQLTSIKLDVPIVSDVPSALTYQPDVLLIGIAPSGGVLPDSWINEIRFAVRAGLSIVNGLHTPMAGMLDEIGASEGQWVWDIRTEAKDLNIGTGKALTLACQRILTVGTDMSVGKMSTSIELNIAAQRLGIKSKFLATGAGGFND